MNEWQLTRYLIDAKKCIDSLLYINSNIEKIKNLDLKEIIDNKMRHFYINLCIIFDYSYSKNELRIKKREDKVIEKIYYERDKNFAHKDIDYEKKEVTELKFIIKTLKSELDYCFKACRNRLPQIISIDYVSYDKNLFRFANAISPKLEEKITNYLYENQNFNFEKELKVFNDSEDIKMVKNQKDYAVIIENGLTLKEGLQNRQDSAIKMNVLFNLNIWPDVNPNANDILEQQEKRFVEFLNDIRLDSSCS